jgi:hypothetical protein
MSGRTHPFTVQSTALAVAIACGLGVPVGAQQSPPAAPQAAPVPNPDAALKASVQTYELALKNAIITAGAKVAQWAQQVNSSVVLNFVAEPEVRAIPLVNNSLVFHVDVAEIGVSSALWVAEQKRFIEPGQASRVAGTLPPADPKPIGMTPSQYFTELVRDGLIDTLLDSSKVLPLGAGQTLTVACSPVDRMGPSSLYRNQSKKLVLTIKGEDLQAFWQGKLSRDEVKRLIDERRF